MSFHYLVRRVTEISCLRERVFEAARNGSYFRPVAVSLRKEKNKENKEESKGGRRSETLYSCRCACKWEDSRGYALTFIFNGTAFT